MALAWRNCCRDLYRNSPLKTFLTQGSNPSFLSPAHESSRSVCYSLWLNHNSHFKDWRYALSLLNFQSQLSQWSCWPLLVFFLQRFSFFLQFSAYLRTFWSFLYLFGSKFDVRPNIFQVFIFLRTSLHIRLGSFLYWCPFAQWIPSDCQFVSSGQPMFPCHRGRSGIQRQIEPARKPPLPWVPGWEGTHWWWPEALSGWVWT